MATTETANDESTIDSERIVINDFVVDLLLERFHKGEWLVPFSFDFDIWKSTIDWPLPSNRVAYRVQQGLARLGGAVILVMQKEGFTLSGSESRLVYDSLTRSPVPGHILKLMGLPCQPPLDANQTLALILYEVSSSSSVGPAAYEKWTAVNTWVATNLGGTIRIIAQKARQLSRQKPLPNHPLPKVFAELRKHWETEAEDVDMDMSE
ncbi:hypothetical protein C8R44DRAFT_879987 [Mycena epipterygia]|nr:hypothetical protein C8R44DRAFT_879987 [Mycena epipterygia]